MDKLTVRYKARAPKGTLVIGHISIGGLDISNRVHAVTVRHHATDGLVMRLDIPLYGDDEVDIEVPADLVRLRPRRVRAA